MKIKVPKSIRLGIYRYRIKFDHKMLMTSGNVGEHRPSAGEIALDPHMSDASMTHSMNHEVMHHINAQYKVGLDEDGIDRISMGWSEYMERCLGIKYDWKTMKKEQKG
jgi:hypothetical protein